MLAMPRVLVDPDAPLMRRIRRGSEAAFEELVHRHGRRLFGLLLRSCRDPHEAEDLTQEVFVRVFRARRRWKPAAKVATWLDRIAMNVARNAARSRSRRAWLRLTPNQSDTFGVEETGGSCRLESEEISTAVHAAIDTLREPAQRAMRWTHLEHRSPQYIAASLDVSPAAVKNLLYRARIRLRVLLHALGKI
jgi:RNA polymerase sigma-70 factor (ECF subfamily)